MRAAWENLSAHTSGHGCFFERLLGMLEYSTVTIVTPGGILVIPLIIHLCSFSIHHLLSLLIPHPSSTGGNCAQKVADPCPLKKSIVLI